MLSTDTKILDALNVHHRIDKEDRIIPKGEVRERKRENAERHTSGSKQ